MLDQDVLKLPEAGKSTKDILTKFSDENDSASAWIKEVGIEEASAIRLRKFVRSMKLGVKRMIRHRSSVNSTKY